MYQTMNHQYDVVIVGAGPSGSTAARICSDKGLKTLMIEEQAHIGYPVQCTGLLSLNAFKECKVSDNSILNYVSGAKIKAGNAICSFHPGKKMACVVNRAALDQEMAINAADAGCDIKLKTIASEISPQSHILKVKGIRGREEIKYSMLIAADGPRSIISRALGIPRAELYLSGLQCDTSLNLEKDYVHIYPNASPDFFGWMIPIGEERARIGMCGITDLSKKFSNFIHPFSNRCTHFVSGTIPLGTLKRTYDEGILIVGDAAALAKPTSGGGVYTGARSALHAALTAVKAIETGKTQADYLKEYEYAWKQDFGNELQKGLRLLQIRQKITPDEMEKIVTTLSNPSVIEKIISKGDIDRPSKLIKGLLLNPHILPIFFQIGKAMIRGGRN